MRKESLKIGKVEIEVTFKNIKNLHLSVHPPQGHVTIASPDFYDLEKVKIYAATKLPWIKKEQRKFLDQKRTTPRKYITRESHFFLGERFLMKVKPSTRNFLQTEGKSMILNVINKDDFTLKERLVQSFYRKELRKKLFELIQYHSRIMGVDVQDFKIRRMKTKWGSCAIDNHRIWFNIELAKKPIECIEYIVVHELVHLLEKNHNKKFIALMDQYLPNWRIQKKILNDLAL